MRLAENDGLSRSLSVQAVYQIAEIEAVESDRAERELQLCITLLKSSCFFRLSNKADNTVLLHRIVVRIKDALGTVPGTQ